MIEKNTKRILLYGGGTQSTALLIMSLQGMFEQVQEAIFAKIGTSEPKFVLDYVMKVKRYVKNKYGFEITIIETPDLMKDVLNHLDGKTKRCPSLPYYSDDNGERGMIMRQCTQEYKILPMNRWIRKNYPKQQIEKWFGISFDERTRMKTPTNKWEEFRYPLIEAQIRRADSIDYLNKIPELSNPPRSSCVFCPFHSDGYWKVLKANYPKEFNRASEFDKKIRKHPKLRSDLYLHKSCVPLEQVDFNSQNDLFEGCDNGYCGI